MKLNGKKTRGTCPKCGTPDVEIEHGNEGETLLHLWHCPECGSREVIVRWPCEDCL